LLPPNLLFFLLFVCLSVDPPLCLLSAIWVSLVQNSIVEPILCKRHNFTFVPLIVCVLENCFQGFQELPKSVLSSSPIREGIPFIGIPLVLFGRKLIFFKWNYRFSSHFFFLLTSIVWLPLCILVGNYFDENYIDFSSI